MSEITTENKNDVNTVHDQLQILQKRLSAMETEGHAGQSSRPPYSIMGGRNEQANLSTINRSGDCSIRNVKVQISSHSSRKCKI